MSIERLRLLKAEKAYEDAFQLYSQLVAMDQADAEVYLIGGQAAKALGNLFAARYALETCLDLAPTGNILGTARFVLGTTLLHLGDVYACIDHLNAFLGGVDLYPSLAALLCGSAHYNRGLAYRQARRLDLAWEDYQLACQADRREGLTEHLRQDLQNLAWVVCLLGNRIAAQEALDEARSLCTHDDAYWQQKVGEAFLASIPDPSDPASDERNSHRALNLCEVIYQSTDPTVPMDVRSHACWIAGRIAFAQGEIALAENLAYQARQWAAKTKNENRCLHDAADLLRAVRTVYLKDSS